MCEIIESKNMNYVFNKEYFDLIFGYEDDKKTAELNGKLFNFKYPESACDYYKKIEAISNQYFSLITIYPGLLIGSGYPHDSGEKESIVGGFSFDYVTGLPIIPGSTLKGMLRSYFKGENVEKNREREILIRDIVGKDNINIDELIENIFEGADVFIGGYPVIEMGKEDILASEYITPHKNPLSDPIPLNMVKVKPGVEYRFYFQLNEYVGENGDCLKPEDKKNLFKELLLLGGIGAKTNVGFGQFKDNDSTKDNTGSEETKNEKALSVGDIAKGTVIVASPFGIDVEISKNKVGRIEMPESNVVCKKISVGNKINVKILKIDSEKIYVSYKEAN